VLDSALTTTAISRATEIPYDAYLQLVVEYPEEELAPLYSAEAAWESMVTGVVQQLEKKVQP
jgi:hypothetical protein